MRLLFFYGKRIANHQNQKNNTSLWKFAFKKFLASWLTKLYLFHCFIRFLWWNLIWLFVMILLILLLFVTMYYIFITALQSWNNSVISLILWFLMKFFKWSCVRKFHILLSFFLVNHSYVDYQFLASILFHRKIRFCTSVYTLVHSAVFSYVCPPVYAICILDLLNWYTVPSPKCF